MRCGSSCACPSSPPFFCAVLSFDDDNVHHVQDTEAEDTWDMTQLLSVRVDTDMVADVSVYA